MVTVAVTVVEIDSRYASSEEDSVSLPVSVEVEPPTTELPPQEEVVVLV